MPYKNPEKNKECIARWNKKHPTYKQEQRAKDPEKHRLAVRKAHQKNRLLVLIHYGAYCHCPGGCQEKALEFLCLDHIEGGGSQHRRSLGTGTIYHWVKKNNFPTSLRVLCQNCNASFAHYGYCPHEREN